MRSLVTGFLATLGLAIVASAAPMDSQRYRVLLETAREYATDRSLIFYCLRGDPVTTPFLWYGLHADLAEALARVKQVSDDRHQHAELVRTVLANVRAYPSDAKDATLDAQCKSKDVEDALATFNGVGRPLFVRPPFAGLGR